MSETAESLVKCLAFIGSGIAVEHSMPEDLKAIVGQSIDRAIGTGIVLRWEKGHALLTCRHVVESVPKGEVLKAQIDNLPVLYLANAAFSFHPSDTATHTADVALLPLPAHIRIGSCVSLPSLKDLSDLRPGVDIELYGFPCHRVKESRGVIMPELVTVSAKLLAANIESPNMPTNYGRRFVRQWVATLDDTIDLTDMEGMSGGLVVLANESGRTPLGMFTGTAKGALAGSDRKVKALQFVPFLEVFTTQ